MTLDLVALARPRWAVVSTYPPTPCGLATFTQALVAGMTAHGARVDVVRVVDEPQSRLPAGVGHHFVNGPDGDVTVTASVLNRYDVVMVQHEFGIYGGADGEELLGLLSRLTVPVVTVLHTVLADPTPHQRQVLEGVIAASDRLVTMTRTARDRVVQLFGACADRVHVVPHGAPDALVAATGPRPVQDRPADVAERRPVILTWGLLGFGKGIEWGIEALALLKDLEPRPLYVVAGQTHPRVLEHEGERYRNSLVATAERLGVADDVVFQDRYLGAAHLHDLIRSADVVLLPYDSVEQVTSGVLTEAVAAGRPVVSSRFPHAVELLGEGTGLLVDRQDPSGIAAAVRQVLTDTDLAGRLSHRAAAVGPGLTWRTVAARYLDLGDTLAGEGRLRVDADAVAVVA
jgi:glycosyltransferase involved in cell wall biosynthesis